MRAAVATFAPRPVLAGVATSAPDHARRRRHLRPLTMLAGVATSAP